MTLNQRIAFAALAGWLSRAVSILSGLVLLPILFRHLGQEELGAWLLLGQSWATLGILDFGLGATFTRRIALARGKTGADPAVPLSQESRREIADLFRSGLILFRIVALFIFFTAWVGGLSYLRQLHFTDIHWSTVMIAWTVLCVGQAMFVWTMVWSSLLLGVGYVGWENVLASAVSIATILVQIGVAFAGGGIIGLAVVAAVGAVISRIAFLSFARRREPDIFLLGGRWNRKLVASMTGPSLKSWLTSLGAVLILNTDQFFIAQVSGTAEIPKYRAAYLLCINLNMIAIGVSRASSVFVSQLWQAGLRDQVRAILRRDIRFGLLVMVCGTAVLLTAGDLLFRIWLGEGNFAGYPLLVIFSAIMIFEAHSFIISNCSRATEDEAFAFWSVTGGILKVAFSLLFIKSFGLLGIALGTLLAQALTNYWYTTYRALRRLAIGWRDHVLRVLFPVAFVFVVALCVGAVLKHFLLGAPILLHLAAVVAGCAAVFSVAVWYLILEPGQRQQMLRKVAGGRQYFWRRLNRKPIFRPRRSEPPTKCKPVEELAP